MKCLAIFGTLLVLCACTPTAKFTQQDLYMLTADSFETTNGRGDFDASLKLLGPPAATQVNIKACPNVSYNAIFRVKSALEKAGYTKIGFAAPDTLRCGSV